MLRVMNIEVMPPNIKKMNKYFTLIKDNPTFGLTEIKGVGGSVFDKMIKCLENNQINLASCDWNTFLIGFGQCIKVDAFEGSSFKWCFRLFQSSS